VRGISAPVRRFVWRRDSGQCTFFADDGRRCPERHRLEFHHDEAYGLGGDRSASNVRLLCPLCRYRHNLHYADCLIMPRRVEPVAGRRGGRGLHTPGTDCNAA